MTMTRQDVVSVLGSIDDVTIAEIIASGASLEELREASAWAFGDEALMSQGRPLPGTRIAALIDLDVAPSFYPVLSSFPAWVVPCWAGEAKGAGAEPLV